MSIELKTPKLEYQSIRGCIYACEYHIVFCTKYRRKCLSVEMQERLKVLIFDKQSDFHYIIRAIETMSDHVHVLVSIDPTQSISTVIGRIKGYTAKVLREEFPILTRMPCLWTRSKFVASTGGVTLKVLKQYIEDQKNK